MLKISFDEIAKWRIEIENGEDFRNKRLGKNLPYAVSGSGENIDYFETGMSSRFLLDNNVDETRYAVLNIVYPIVKNVIPTLYWKNPYINAIPKRVEDEDSAGYVSAILNYYLNELNLKNVNKQIIFDAYVLGMGICKIGYTTKFGTNPTEENIVKEKKEREVGKTAGILEKLGLRKPREEEKPVQNPELDEFIRSELPFVCWISPFDFVIDPRANSIATAQWVAHRIRKTLKSVKANTGWRNTDKLEGTPISEFLDKEIAETMIDDFKTVDIYEIHYKTEEGIYILTLAKDGQRHEALDHKKSIYEMDGFQFEELTFNKHNHGLYPKSDIDIFKSLQDRMNLTFEGILDQVDKYVPKLFVNETAVTEQGKRALVNGDVGAIVYTNTDPNNVVKEGNFVQLKADLVVLIDKFMDIIMLETGMTKAQLMGLTSAETATEAQIGQAGMNLRLSDKLDSVSDFSSRQSRKLWQVIRQFVDLEEIQLITGESGIDEVTGQPKFSWMPDIDSTISEKLAKGEYRFDIEVGSTEKPDLPILRKQIENLSQLLMGEGVLQAFQMQGYKINIAEIFKRYLKLFPDVFKDMGKIIQPITPQTQGLLPMQPPPQAQGGGMGALPRPQQFQQKTPNMADIISSIGGEKGSMSQMA